jgi:hypothetical protein
MDVVLRRYKPDMSQCTTRHIPYGILTRDWLKNATFEGLTTWRGVPCEKWGKANFITYYAETTSQKPVAWVFFNGMVMEVVQYTVGVAPPKELLRVPSYCGDSVSGRQGGLWEHFSTTQ